MGDDELEKLKAARKQQLQDDDQTGQQQEELRKQLKQIASQVLTEEARSRLGNIRAADPDLAAQIELQLVQLYRTGQLQDKLTDDDLKTILKKIRDSGDEQTIKYTKPGQ